MKKIQFLLIFVITLVSNCILSQETNKISSSSNSKGFYIDVYAGYAYKMSTENLVNSFEMYNVSMENGNTKYEVIHISLGQGFNFGGTVGYMFNKYIGTEIGISYIWGKTFEANIHTELTNEKYTLASNMVRVLPSIVLHTGFKKFNPYARLGLVIGIGKVIYAYEDYYIPQTTEIKYYGGVAFGVNAALGSTFTLNNRFSLFGEISTINMSYGPAKSKITKATENGQDILPNLHVYNKEAEYVNSYVKEPYDRSSTPPG